MWLSRLLLKQASITCDLDIRRFKTPLEVPAARTVAPQLRGLLNARLRGDRLLHFSRARLQFGQSDGDPAHR
jgi:hypothetical protein